MQQLITGLLIVV